MWPLGHAGLTLATSLGACVNAALLFAFLRRRGFYDAAPGWFALPCRAAVALAVLAAVLLAVAGPADVLARGRAVGAGRPAGAA